MKVRQIIDWVIVGISLLFALMIFCPLQDGQLGYLVIFSNYRLIIAYFASIIACLLLILNKKIKNIEIISLILFVTSSVFYIFHLISNEYANGFIVGAIILEIICSLHMLYSLNERNEFEVRDIVESAMLIALAIGLDLPGIKIRVGVNGGSISFTMLPLFILALRLGTFKGFLGIGLVYGAITCALDGWGMQYFLFDYLLAYGSIALIGIFAPIIMSKGPKYPWINVVFVLIGVITACFFRLLFATLSGMIFYETPFVESLAYNALYVLPSGGACLVLLAVLFRPLQIINEKFPTKRTTL